MKATCPLMSALPTPLTCPLRILFMTRVSLPGSLCRFQGKEAHGWLDQPFDEPMILLDDGIEILDLPQVCVCRQDPTRCEVGHGLGRGRILLHVADARCRFGSLRGIRSARFHWLE